MRRVQRHGVDAVFTCDPTPTARWPSLRTHAREYIRACLHARALARAPWSGQTGGHLSASTTRARARFFAWRLERAAARRTTRAPKRASARMVAKAGLNSVASMAMARQPGLPGGNQRHAPPVPEPAKVPRFGGEDAKMLHLGNTALDHAAARVLWRDANAGRDWRCGQ